MYHTAVVWYWCTYSSRGEVRIPGTCCCCFCTAAVYGVHIIWDIISAGRYDDLCELAMMWPLLLSSIILCRFFTILYWTIWLFLSGTRRKKKSTRCVCHQQQQCMQYSVLLLHIQQSVKTTYTCTAVTIYTTSLKSVYITAAVSANKSAAPAAVCAAVLCTQQQYPYSSSCTGIYIYMAPPYRRGGSSTAVSVVITYEIIWTMCCSCCCVWYKKSILLFTFGTTGRQQYTSLISYHIGGTLCTAAAVLWVE